MKWLTLVIFSLLLTLNACAPSRQTFNESEHSKIKTIAILNIDDPENYGINDTTSAMFGLVGLGIERSINGPKEDRLTAEFTQRNFHLGIVLRDRLRAELESMHYRVVLVDVPRAQPDEFLSDYSHVHTDADAVFDAVIRGAGFVAPYGFYWPNEIVWVQMVETSNQQVLFSDHAICADIFTATVPLDEQNGSLKFNAADEILANPDRAANALSAAMAQLAQYFVNRLQ